MGADAGDCDIHLNVCSHQAYAAQRRFHHRVRTYGWLGSHVHAARAQHRSRRQREFRRKAALRVGVAGHHTRGDAAHIHYIGNIRFGICRSIREHAQRAVDFHCLSAGDGGVFHTSVGHCHVDADADERTRALPEIHAGDRRIICRIHLRLCLQFPCADRAAFHRSEVPGPVQGNQRAHADVGRSDVEPIQFHRRASGQPCFHKDAAIGRNRARAAKLRLVARVVVGNGHVHRAGNCADIRRHGGRLGKRLTALVLRARKYVDIASGVDVRARGVDPRAVARAHLRIGHGYARGNRTGARVIEVGLSQRVGKRCLHSDVAARAHIDLMDSRHRVAAVEGQQHIDRRGHRPARYGEDERLGMGRNCVAHTDAICGLHGALISRRATRDGLALWRSANVRIDVRLVDGNRNACARRHSAAIDAKERSARRCFGIGRHFYIAGRHADALPNQRMTGQPVDGKRYSSVDTHRAAAERRRRRKVSENEVSGYGDCASALDVARARDGIFHRAIRAHCRYRHAHGHEAAAGRERRRQHVAMVERSAQADVSGACHASRQFGRQHVIEGNDRRRYRHANITAARSHR